MGGGWRLDMNAFVAGVIALSVVVAAYSSEVWVASLKAVPPGQAEAARSLGLESKQVFFLVQLPQLGRVALPGLGNIWTILVKDTSLISMLAVTRPAARGLGGQPGDHAAAAVLQRRRGDLPGLQHLLRRRAGVAGAAGQPGLRLMWQGLRMSAASSSTPICLRPMAGGCWTGCRSPPRWCVVSCGLGFLLAYPSVAGAHVAQRS